MCQSVQQWFDLNSTRCQLFVWCTYKFILYVYGLGLTLHFTFIQLLQLAIGQWNSATLFYFFVEHGGAAGSVASLQLQGLQFNHELRLLSSGVYVHVLLMSPLAGGFLSLPKYTL